MTNFPTFQPLTLQDRPELEAVTSLFEPYSDFNFVSLFSWNTDGTTQISNLNGNLVVCMPDYLSGEPIYTLLGSREVEDTAKQLLSRTDTLVLVPEPVATILSGDEQFMVSEDPDQHDYVFSVEQLVELGGQHYRSQRKAIYRFTRQYGDMLRLVALSLSDEATKARILDTFDRWASERQKNAEDTANEREAVSRLLANAEAFNLVGVELFIGEVNVGFSINEILRDSYGICHFHKTLLNYRGIDPYLTRESIRTLQEAGCNFVNWEQDLGIPGLRELKQSYHPVKALKKYTVRLT